MKQTIRLKRAYEKHLKKDGLRVLVDRLWPRGVSKEEAFIDEWAKDLAPSTALRKWFSHDPSLWPGFQKKYRAELRKNEAITPFIEAHAHSEIITLVFAAKDEEHTHAIVLKEFLEERQSVS